MNDPAFVKEQANSLAEYFEIDEAKLDEYKTTFDNLINEEFIAIDENNHLFVTEKFILSLSEEALNTIRELVQFMNNSIDSGLISFEINSTMNYSFSEASNRVISTIATYRVKVTPFSEFIKNEEGMALMSATASTFMNDDTKIQSTRSATFNLASLVNANKIRIRNYYAMYLSIMGADAAFTATVGVWVSLVRNNGAWDYKTQEGYKNNNFNCIYGPKGSYSAIMSSAQIGNYNYGYTGWLLFPQIVLLTGSIVVQGSINGDKHDWADIKAGYRDSGDVNYK